MDQLPRKLLSIRGRNVATYKRSKSSDHTESTKNRQRATESFFALFRPTSKGSSKDDKNGHKAVQEVRSRLSSLHIFDITDDSILDSLNTKFAAGDVDKAVRFIVCQNKALAGEIIPYNPAVQLQGAENRNGVTCYLDALLFAMFARLESYEQMLCVDFDDEPPRKLAALLRLWVNLLRSGELIHTDTVALVQETLSACGWKEAGLLEQQDTSEAFAVITEALQLPLLSLQVDLYHHGEGDDEDHKVVQERLLNIAVPAEVPGKSVHLEDCMEEYFNSKVDVSRGDAEHTKSGGAVVETMSVMQDDTGLESPSSSKFAHIPISRSSSLIQRVVIDDDGKFTLSDSDNALKRAMQKGATIMKAVTIPAWQFFRLIPWYLPLGQKPNTDVEVAMNFRQRPIVGICLKRYLVAEDGTPKRHDTRIEIPESLYLPHFMVECDSTLQEENNSLTSDYKFVLQSIVCHRGVSVYSGHYISFARVPSSSSPTKIVGKSEQFQEQESRWLKFDDSVAENRVVDVTNIYEALEQEMPYLLFYQITPMVPIDPDDPSIEKSISNHPSKPTVEDHRINISANQVSNQSVNSEHQRMPCHDLCMSPSMRVDKDPARIDLHLPLNKQKEPRIRLSYDLDRCYNTEDILDSDRDHLSVTNSQTRSQSASVSRRGSRRSLGDWLATAASMVSDRTHNTNTMASASNNQNGPLLRNFPSTSSIGENDKNWSQDSSNPSSPGIDTLRSFIPTPLATEKDTYGKHQKEDYNSDSHTVSTPTPDGPSGERTAHRLARVAAKFSKYSKR